MRYRISGSSVLGCEAVGFGAIILLSWLNELSGVPHLLLGGPFEPNWREAALETAVVLVVAVPVLLLSWRIVSRLHYLEGFLRVCAWCRRLHHDGQWIPVEEFFRERFDTSTSHGMCPDCWVKALRESPPEGRPTP